MTQRIRSTDPAIRSASVQGEPLSAGHRVSPTTIVNRRAWSPINVTRPCVCLLHIGLRYRYRIIRRLESIPVEKKTLEKERWKTRRRRRRRILLLHAHWRGISFPSNRLFLLSLHLFSISFCQFIALFDPLSPIFIKVIRKFLVKRNIVAIFWRFIKF